MSDTTTTVTLDTPIKRQGGDITAITLRKPTAGELRGLSLKSLVNLEVDTIAAVLPRISEPMLTAQDMNAMDLVDLARIGAQINFFFLTKSERQGLPIQSM